ncbi:MAG: DUF87 domain-containing protein [bacterium]|nr:DUF87 domain-containing protein [bacterium]
MNNGTFYLGKEISPDDYSERENNYLYKADDLTTHAMVFGMTGSGKTGLCIDLMEEAVDEDVPIIIIDPKGDLTNLALMFPDFSPSEFLKWTSTADAQREGKTPEQYAEEKAALWQKGLAGWGIDAGRMQGIKDKTITRIFTPGSSAGLRISILEGFKKPAGNFYDDEESMVEKIRNSVSALLALLDIENDPLKSNPHILISNIVEYYWKLGRDLSIEDLIINIQKPPIQKLGAFSIDKLIDEKERLELSFKINNIIASPSFRFWATGTPLSADLLYKKVDGKVPINIFYIAHLPENERMFSVTLLLNEIVYWMRKQPGSGNLKYLLYMDEIFGYLPPYPKNPPSKNPLLILLKQARAFGLGVVLATQNPKDIDYKALTNMGTWFVGKLQAEGDRERVLEGMTGIAGESGEALDNDTLRTMMAALGSRKFLVKNVHRGIKLFRTRWAMSYLAGPLTREQIKVLTRPQKQAPVNSYAPSSHGQPHGAYPGQPPQAGFSSPGAGVPCPPNGPQYRPPINTPGLQATAPSYGGAHIAGPPLQAPPKHQNKHLLPYEPQPEITMDCIYDNTGARTGYYSLYIYMDGELIFDDRSSGLYLNKKYFVKAPLRAAINWRKASISEQPPVFSPEPEKTIDGYEPFQVKPDYNLLRRLRTSFKNYLFNNLSLDLYTNKELNLVSDIDEGKDAFAMKCREVMEKMIEKELEQVKDSYSKKIKRLTDKLEVTEAGIEKLEREHKSKKMEEYLAAGESLLGFLTGRKSRRGLSSAARKRRTTSTAGDKVKLKQSKASQLEEEILSLTEELEDKIVDIEDSYYDKADKIEAFEVRLEKNDTIIARQALLWRLI